MAIQTINIGSSANKGDGDPLRTAFKKINENFAELNTTNTVRDIKGSVFGDDSTLLVDAVNSLIPSSVLSGNLPALDGSALTNLTIPAQTFASLTSKPTTLAGYGITDGGGGSGGAAFTNIGIGADDSTIRTINEGESFLIKGGTGITTASDAEGNITVTGVAQDFTFASLTGKPTTIAGYGITDALALGTSASTALAGNTALFDGDYGSLSNSPSLFDGQYASLSGKPTIPSNVSDLTNDSGFITSVPAQTFASLTSKPSTISGYGITDAYTKTEVDNLTTTLDGDFTGSVFGDDSTLLVDGNNNKIVGAVDTASLRTSEFSIALGNLAGETTQGTQAVAIGTTAGRISQGDSATAIGQGAGISAQGAGATAVGEGAGAGNQGAQSVAVGRNAGSSNQAANSVAIGDQAGKTTQSSSAVALGDQAGLTNQGTESVAIGLLAGKLNQGAQTIAIGSEAGRDDQSANGIALGHEAGRADQADYGIAIGEKSGNSNQGIRGIAIGRSSGKTDQGTKAVAIGDAAGYATQGAGAIAIGDIAGETNQAANSIVINASGTALNNTTASSLVIKPIVNLAGTTHLQYNATSGQVTHSDTITATIVATTATPPTANADAGATGEIRYDDNYLYIKTASGWKRTALSGIV